MSAFERVIQIHPVGASVPTGTAVAKALMREITEALGEYVRARRSHVIDLTGMPLSEEDRQFLDDRLGRGELSITIDALFSTRIDETRYAGVWRVRHYGSDGELRGERIEVIDVPEIVRAGTADIERSARRLEAANIEEGA